MHVNCKSIVVQVKYIFEAVIRSLDVQLHFIMHFYYSFHISFGLIRMPENITNQSVAFAVLRDTRAPVLEQSLRKLGVEKLSKEDVQKMQWEVLEAKIGSWIHFMRIAVRICRISLLRCIFSHPLVILTI